MAYYSVLDLTLPHDTWIPDYLPTANKLVAKHGGKYLARTTTHEHVKEKQETLLFALSLNGLPKKQLWLLCRVPNMLHTSKLVLRVL